MLNNKITLIAASLLFFSGTTTAQDCWPDYIISTTPLERFVIDEGIVLDAFSGLEWTRCSFGQTFKNGSCEGVAKEYLTWKDALVDITAINEAGHLNHNDWRLPNLNELSTLVERQCFDPAINLDAFPDTASNALFTSTPNVTGSVKEGRYIYMADGAEFAPAVSLTLNIKLTRDR